MLGLLKGVVDVELPVLGEVRMKGESEKAFLKLLSDHIPGGEIEKSHVVGRRTVFGEDGDFAKLLNEKESVRAIGRNGEVDGELEFLVFESLREFDLRSCCSVE